MYTAFEAEEAFALAQRLEIHYTPKHGSWLDIAEIELSALGRQCLCSRRIDCLKTLNEELLAWYVDRNSKQTGIMVRSRKVKKESISVRKLIE